MSAPVYDAAIIGAGHNGLVTAAYLAKAGLKVVVLEANDRPGGGAVTRTFAPGFRAPAVAHLLHALHPRVARDLGLKRLDLRRGLKATGTAVLLPGGGRIEISEDAAATSAAITRLSPADAAAYAPAMARLVRLSTALGGYMLRTPPSPSMAANDLRTKIDLGLFALSLRRLGRKDLLELTRILTMNVADLAGDLFESDAVKGLLAFEATLGAYLGPRSPNTVFNLLYRLSSFGPQGMGGFFLPVGGMGAFGDMLGKAAERAGAAIRLKAPVERILVEKGVAAGVVLVGGEEVRARLVASSADPQSTLLKLVAPGQLDVQFLKRIRHLRMNGCVAKIHLALDGLPDGWAAGARRLVYAPAINHVERAFDCAKYGRVSDNPALEVVLPSLGDASLAPAGKHVASILFQYAPYRLRSTSPDDARRQVLERGLDTLEALAPGTTGRVLASEVLIPQDLESQFGLSGGQWHHGEVTLDQMFFLRPAGGFQRYRMPIPGLWLCGAGAHPGGNVSGAAGTNAAREILRELKQRRAGR